MLKFIAITALITTSISTLAFGTFNSVPSQFPTESGWAVTATELACDFDAPSEAVGTITKTESGVLYTTKLGGEVIGSAVAKSTFFMAGVSCVGDKSFDMPDMKYPTVSDWSINRVEKACAMELSENAKGSMTKSDAGVVYTVTVDGSVVASATANSSWIWAKLSCAK